MDDYSKVKLLMLHLVKGITYTKKVMIFYLVLFVVSCALPALIGSADLLSFVVCMLVSLFWLYKSFLSYRKDTDRIFAKTVFKLSIIVITAVCLTMG